MNTYETKDFTKLVWLLFNGYFYTEKNYRPNAYGDTDTWFVFPGEAGEVIETPEFTKFNAAYRTAKDSL
jgi:hypothetical protein